MTRNTAMQERPAARGLRLARRQLMERGELARELVGAELASSWLRSWQAGLQPCGRWNCSASWWRTRARRWSSWPSTPRAPRAW